MLAPCRAHLHSVGIGQFQQLSLLLIADLMRMPVSCRKIGKKSAVTGIFINRKKLLATDIS
ncbi:MAG: hypothetical protein A3E79_12705 [Burkholderiales bacterium RIFCSPHIGHO2_12_FULL_61_11]|nr:MAG: hypothetical protein A3E79_12705 [Burkholderiales bacterium RIFCSPHIGHO2_12_FULL_61_11]